MAYIKHDNGFQAGDIVLTSRKVDSYAGYFEKGTLVCIVNISERGYDLEDAHGNRITETGFDSVEKIVFSIALITGRVNIIHTPELRLKKSERKFNMIIKNEKVYRKREGIYNCFYKRTTYMLLDLSRFM